MSANPDVNDAGMTQVDIVEHPQAGARAFATPGPPKVTLVVWDRSSDMHTRGEVWGLFVDNDQLVTDTIGAQTNELVAAAKVHYGRQLHIIADQRGLSEAETQILAAAGLTVA